MGFCPKKSAVNIFMIRKMFEKCYEHNSDLHNILVNYTQAFDSVYRNKIPECLSPYNFPAKLKRLIELTVINTRTRVKINNESAEELKVESEVKQGDPLIASLFSVVVDVILRQLVLRGNI